ncbi:amino acid ABC transporter permease [Variovorax sp. HW608]|uniref:amino acid ABC transporter permease n=1 Tax=Variovorax sp. HW608 TaxID=1034889 RepID=UPI0012FE46B7|nr:amino acid ABC transporter permease [Variovorax sp. HW608]
MARWAVLDATWQADSADQCTAVGACWAVIRARYRLLLFGLYPHEEQWRAALACGVTVATLLTLCWRRMWQPKALLALFVGAPVAFVSLMSGGLPGLPFVPTDRWGGLALTFFLYLVGIVVGLPLGVLLAISRRSERRAVAATAAFLVDAVRTLPMVMILFTVGVLAPMVFPEGFAGDKLWRVAVAFAFAFGCYESEIVRAGLQAIPTGQDEAAKALALTPYQRMRLVLLPQALTNGLPATVNLLVATFKETSIVAIIGYFDFAASAQAAYGNADWAGAYVEVYLFVAAVYFGFASVIGWLGHRIEHRVRIDRS